VLRPLLRSAGLLPAGRQVLREADVPAELRRPDQLRSELCTGQVRSGLPADLCGPGELCSGELCAGQVRSGLPADLCGPGQLRPGLCSDQVRSGLPVDLRGAGGQLLPEAELLAEAELLL
jgi:hypothetical protein